MYSSMCTTNVRGLWQQHQEHALERTLAWLRNQSKHGLALPNTAAGLCNAIRPLCQAKMTLNVDVLYSDLVSLEVLVHTTGRNELRLNQRFDGLGLSGDGREHDGAAACD